MSQLIIEVGKSYARGNGEKVNIVEDNGNIGENAIRFSDDKGYGYTLYGLCNQTGGEPIFDLEREVPSDYKSVKYGEWLPIEQFTHGKEFNSREVAYGDHMVLLYGEGFWYEGAPSSGIRVWSLESSVKDKDNKIHFQAETWGNGNWMQVVPTKFMVVKPPSF